MFYFVTKKLPLVIARTCRPVYCILFAHHRDQDDARRFIYTRYICSYFCGLFFAWLFWKLIVINFNITLESEFYVLAILITCIGIGFVFSTSVKCIILLIFVAMLGKSGRSYLRALSFAFIITGPIENLSENGAEIVRVFSCSTILTYNLTKTRFDLMTKPFQNTLITMKDDIRDVKNAFAEVENIIEPIRSEIESDDPELSNITIRNIISKSASSRGDAIQSKYKDKLRKRCKQQLDKGKQRCHGAFDKAYKKCLQKFPHIIKQILCWPFRVDFICAINLFGDPDKVCDPSDALPSDFGENYAELELAQQTLYQNASQVKVDYTINSKEIPIALKNVEETADSIRSDFKAKKRVFDNIMVLMERFLSFLFLRIIFSSLKYYWKYTHQIEFDNLYVSTYFKHVDNRRKLQGKRYILPLKKYERNNLIDTSLTCSHTKEEKKAVLFHMLQFSLEVITSSFFILLDYVIVSLLEIIHLRSEISYVQEGEHTVQFHIEGTGLMARLLRSTLRNFNIHQRVSTYLSNESCLPNPKILPQSFYLKLIALYVGVIFLIYKSTTFLRLRRLVCGYFYYKREKQRILYLYNNLLKQQHAFFEVMLKKAEENVTKRQIRRRLNLLLNIRLRYPTYFEWLKYFNAARRKCLVCDDLEDDDFVICTNTTCGFAYCHNCWQDIELCLICKQRITVTYILNFKQFFEEFTFT